MSDSQNAYRQIVKATSLFSGVQFLNIVFAIIRSKVAAIFIGPVGIGILGVLNSTINLISGFTKLGLDVSSVKDISFAHEQGDQKQIVHTVSTLSRILWFTGLAGTLITMVLSSWLSQIAFGSNEFTFSFVWIAIAILFKQLTIGNMAVMQGLRKLKSLAKANLISSFVSVLIVVPLYYYFGIDGIVPVIIFTALFTFIISRYFTSGLTEKGPVRSPKETFIDGKKMMQLGAVLSISSLVSLVVAYVMQVYITNTGGVTEVGFYNAGIIIINSYVGLIFNAMSKDYFPRLSGIANDNMKIRKIVTYQASVAVLFITPIIVIFLVFMPYIIQLLYTKEFLPIMGFVTFAILGTLFKSVSWSMGYVIIAKGDSKVFIKTAIGFNALLLFMNIIGYNYYGLTGLGISFILYYAIHLLVLKWITGLRYKLRLERGFYYVFFICLLFCIATFLFTFIKVTFVRYVLMIVMIAASVIYTYYQLNLRMNLTEILRDLFKKK